MNERVKYAKRYMDEDFDFQLQAPRKQKRDFGATFMTLPELERGVKRATKKAKRTEDAQKREMYKLQATAYEDRIQARYKTPKDKAQD
jgi:hypothetical protein